MKSFGWMLLLLAMSTFLLGWSFGENKPQVSELEKAFKVELPEFLKMTNFDVEILENLGNKVTPRWGSRFKATVKNNVPLYVFSRDDSIRQVTIVDLKTDKGVKIEIYGVIYSTPYQGKWKHTFNIDGTPEKNLGTPLNQFNGEKVLIKGSQDEEIFFTDPVNLLVGTWREFGKGRDDSGDIITFNSDGTYHTIGKQGEIVGIWRYADDHYYTTKTKYKLSGTWQTYVKSTTWKFKISYIDTTKCIAEHVNGIYGTLIKHRIAD